MKISELMIRDIRATIEFGDESIIIRNPKGEVKNDLLIFFKSQLDRNIDNISRKKGRKKKLANDVEIFKLLLDKLTNIKVDIDDLNEVLSNPSYELSMVMLYLSSIMQELIFEILATHNLEMRMEQNTILEKDTLNRIVDLENIIKEVKHRKLIENGKEI